MLPPNSRPLLRAGAACPPNTPFPALAPSLDQAHEYCRRLARSHYENFSVATWFLPKQLRQHFFNVYAYCRISDDLGDEVGDAAASLALLDAMASRTRMPATTGSPRHPVFVRWPRPFKTSISRSTNSPIC